MKNIAFDEKKIVAKRQLRKKQRERRISGYKSHERYMDRIARSTSSRPVYIQAPKSIRLFQDEARDKLIKTLQRIQSHLNAGNKVILAFGLTEELHTCGTLYLLAHLDLFLERYPNSFSCKRPKFDVVEQLFQHIGILKKFGIEEHLEITAENVINWHYAAGVDATTSAFKELLLQHEEAMGGLITRSELYDCMSEAVTNTRKHAYPESLPGRWWMFSQASEDMLTVAICDLGIGIPESLMQKEEMADFLRKLLMVGSKGRHEKKLIEIATSSNRSSTGLPYRGKGLPQMLDFAKKCDRGGFRAHSGLGCYNYSASERRARTMAYSLPIRGTLLQWKLPLNTREATATS